MAEKVCRLCRRLEDLVWVFDDDVQTDLNEIIESVSSVKISKNDNVTQMVCQACRQIAIKVYKFRLNCIQNDKELKAESRRSRSTNNAANIATKSCVPFRELPVGITTRPPQPQIPQRYSLAHPSVRGVLSKNPNVSLPESCLKCHVDCYVTLLATEVDDYYRRRNFTDAQIVEIKKGAYETATGAKRMPPTKRRRSSGDEDVNKKTESTSECVENRKLNVITEFQRQPPLQKGVTSHQSSCDNIKTVPATPRVKTIRIIPNPPCDNNKRNHPNSEMILNSLLQGTRDNKENHLKQKEVESLAQTNQKSGVPQNEAVIIEVVPSQRQPPRNSESLAIRHSTPTDSFLTVPEEDFEFFTSRPFLNKTPVDSPGTSSPFSDCIVFDLDSSGSASPSPPCSSEEKTSFTTALGLVAKAPESSNQPDLSLIEFVTKTRLLYTCRVCDSQHTSLKEMRLHERKMHTRCPFCDKKFRTMAKRNEHVEKDCPINSTLLQKPVLLLKRVDEDEEVRRKYPGTFGAVVEEPNREVVVDLVEEGSTQENAEGPNGEGGQPRVVVDLEERDGRVLNAVHELENFLDAPIDVDEVQGQEVICISDDETDVQSEPRRSTRHEETFNVVNSEILDKVNFHDTDSNVLKSILRQSLARQKERNREEQWSLANNRIVDGANPRVKIFKNLAKYLQQYNVPIEIKDSHVVWAHYQNRTPPPPKTLTGRWTDLPVEQLKPLKTHKS